MSAADVTPEEFRKCSECQSHGCCADEARKSKGRGFCHRFHRSRRSLEAELARLRSELASLREIELSEECTGLLVAHGSDGVVIVAGEFSSGKEFREKFRTELASRPVAVEVPKRPFPVLDLHGEPMRGISLMMYCRGWDDLASKLKPVDPSRLLKEGHVQVPVEELESLRRLHDAVEVFRVGPWPEGGMSSALNLVANASVSAKSLRSNGGAKEGGQDG